MVASALDASPNIPLITIVCSWTFVAVALIFLGPWIWTRVRIRRKFDLASLLLILACITTFALAQITWVIVDEGGWKHEDEVARSKLRIICGVSFLFPLISYHKLIPVQTFVANETLSGLVNTMLRVSVLLAIKELFGIKKSSRRVN